MEKRSYFEIMILTLVIVVFSFFTATDTPAEDYQLKAPSFSAKMASTQEVGNVFPVDSVGICAYIKTEKLDLEKVATAIPKVTKLGGNYIRGEFEFQDFISTSKVYLYADTNGWLVAYLAKSEPVANLIWWRVDLWVNTLRDFNFREHNKLARTLSSTRSAAGISTSMSINYYDFRFPNATYLTFFTKFLGGHTGTRGIIRLNIPENFTLYNASYSFSSDTNREKIGFKVDETVIQGRFPQERGGIITDNFQGTITVGKLHEVEITTTSTMDDRAAVAIALLY